METNDNINTSLCQNAAHRAMATREAARVNPNAGTVSNARLKTLDFLRMMAKRRAARGVTAGRPGLTGAALKSWVGKRTRKYREADKARRSHYFAKHGF